MKKVMKFLIITFLIIPFICNYSYSVNQGNMKATGLVSAIPVSIEPQPGQDAGHLDKAIHPGETDPNPLVGNTFNFLIWASVGYHVIITLDQTVQDQNSDHKSHLSAEWRTGISTWTSGIQVPGLIDYLLVGVRVHPSLAVNAGFTNLWARLKNFYAEPGASAGEKQFTFLITVTDHP